MRAAERLGRFEALLDGDDVPAEVRDAYGGLVEFVPAFREQHARALARMDATDEPQAGTPILAIQAREWIAAWRRSARPRSFIGALTLFGQADDEWRSSRNRFAVPYGLFQEIARTLLVERDGGYEVTPLR